MSTEVFYGPELWENEPNPNTRAFNSGVLLFNNCKEIKDLFQKTNNHIKSWKLNKKKALTSWEQPFLNYNTIKNNLQDYNKINKYVYNNVSSDKKLLDQKYIIFYHVSGIGDKVKYLRTYYNKYIKQSGGFKLKYILIS